MFCPQKDRAANGCNSQATCLHACLHLSWSKQPCAWLIFLLYPLHAFSSAQLILFVLACTMAVPVSPVEADPTTPRKNRCTYSVERQPLQQLSPRSPKVVAFGSVPPLPPDAPPSAATASASASASDAPPHVKTWKQLTGPKDTCKIVELSSPSSSDDEPPGLSPPTPPSSPGRPAGCISLVQPAERAESNPIPEVPGDTGCTCDPDREPKKTIQNRFDFKRRRYLNDRTEPELASYWTFLHSTFPKGDPNVKRFKEEVSECRNGCSGKGCSRKAGTSEP